MDLPAPVSPVRTLNDCSNSIEDRLDDREIADRKVPDHRVVARERPSRLTWRRKCHRIMGLTEFHRTCYGCTLALFPAAHPLPVQRRCRCARLDSCSWPCSRSRTPRRPFGALSASFNSSSTPAWCRRRHWPCCWLFSVVSWGIILGKAVRLRGARSGESQSFLDVFRRAPSSLRCRASASRWSTAPWSGLFQAGYAELNLQLRPDAQATPPSPGAPAARPTLEEPRRPSTARCCGPRRSR